MTAIANNSELLFSYGTLQLESVQLATFRRKLTGFNDALPEFSHRTISMTLALCTLSVTLLLGETPSAPRITVPPGFVVELVAGPPLVERPMMAGFDDRGRLFVCDSSGFNLTKGTSDVLVNDPPHMIRVLEDSDGDGRFDTSSIFADKMTFPMGALWHNGALYTASPPFVWRLKETDTPGVAGQREVFVQKFQFGGNACDIHGPFRGPDGNIYWAGCQREFEIPRREGGLLKGKAAGVFRIRPDGSQVEMLCAGGMDNPVEVAFTSEGEAFATANLMIGSPRPRSDGIIHCIDGGLFPYRKLDRSFTRTGEVLPPMIDLGWVAPAGLMRYEDDAFGAEYKDNLFSAQFNTRSVVRHVVERHGATFRGTTEDFLVSDDPDFHPTDVLQDADGSLLVIDTGGWFLRGCPTSQIAKLSVMGAIYRVRRSNAPAVADARGLKIAWRAASSRDLTGYLDDPRWAVRDRAVEELGMRGESAVADLKGVIRSDGSIRSRRNAVWALARHDSPAAHQAVRQALLDSSDSVRLTAATVAGLWRDADAAKRLQSLASNDPLPAMRREAATALGRIGSADAVPILLQSLRGSSDRFLEHAQIHALIRIADPAATRIGLSDSDPHVQRAALLALDQMANGNLTREQVVPLLRSADAELQRTALTTATENHPQWADAVSALLREWLENSALPQQNREILRTALHSLSAQPVIQDLVRSSLSSNKTPAASRMLLLEAIAQASIEKLPVGWTDAIRRIAEQSDEPLARQAIATIHTRNAADFDDLLLGVSHRTELSPDTRLAALAAAAARLPALEPALFDFVKGQLDEQQPVLSRLAAASALSQLPLSTSQLTEITSAVASASPVELPHLLATFERSPDGKVGRQLISALDRSPGLEGLSPESLHRALQKYPDDVQAAADSLFHRLNESFEQQSTRLAELAASLPEGNAAQGRTIFFGALASCAACHSISGQGGNIGPDLSKIGAIRTARDLLESIVLPSASIVRSFESFQIATTDGRIHTGILKQSAADAITVTTTERKEIRIPRPEIDVLEPSRVSIMPQGLEKQLSRQQLSDLIAYLSSLK